MVDTASLIIGIVAIIVAIVAIVLVFIRKGSDGSQGNVGLSGDQGPQGISGSTPGEPGPKGPTGPAFSIGDTGPMGPIGNSGIKGPTGIDGIKGSNGVIGSKGSIGGYFSYNTDFVINDSTQAPYVYISDLNNRFINFVKNGNNPNNNIVLGDPKAPTNFNWNYGDNILFNVRNPDPIRVCTICNDGSNTCGSSSSCPLGAWPIFVDQYGNPLRQRMDPGYSFLFTIVNKPNPKGTTTALYRSISKLIPSTQFPNQ